MSKDKEGFTTIEGMQRRARELRREGYIILKALCSCCDALSGYSCFREKEGGGEDSIFLQYQGEEPLTEERLDAVYQYD